MNFPFTTEQFLNVFGSYNLSVWPAQVFIIIIALFSIFLSIYKIKYSSRLISISIAFLWLWIGIIYHYMFFAKINKAAYAFAVLFIIQALLFLYYGVIKNSLSFNYTNSLKGVFSILLFTYAFIFYPLLGYAFGHSYPRFPTFGLPCPTTIFTFGLLLLLEGKVNKVLFIIPVLWAVIGFTAALKLGIVQDIGLLVSAVITLIAVIFAGKTKQAV